MVIGVGHNNNNTTKWGDYSSLQTDLQRSIQDGNINPLLDINSADARIFSIDISSNFMWPERCLITLISVKT